MIMQKKELTIYLETILRNQAKVISQNDEIIRLLRDIRGNTR